MKYLILLSLFALVYPRELCNLKIADNELAAFKGGSDLIYDEGIINEKFEENNKSFKHVSSYVKDIDYFYATEYHIQLAQSAPHPKLVK
jgi:hypothetical protein